MYRFLMRLRMEYPEADDERETLRDAVPGTAQQVPMPPGETPGWAQRKRSRRVRCGECLNAGSKRESCAAATAKGIEIFE
jgi:hypothetical protein